MSVSDGADRTGLLIDCIQNYEFLYNLQNTNYKNNNMKEQAWTEISAVLEIDAEECKKLWKSLRDKYTREKRECSKSGSAAPESTWEYFERMRFYGKYTKPRKTYTSGRVSGESTPSSAWSTYEQVVSAEMMVDDMQETLVDTIEDVEPGPAPKTPSAIESTPKVSKSSSKRKNDAGEDTFISVAKEIVSGLSDYKKQKANANRTLAEYIFAELEEMPQEEAKLKRKELLNTMCNV